MRIISQEITDERNSLSVAIKLDARYNFIDIVNYFAQVYSQASRKPGVTSREISMGKINGQEIWQVIKTDTRAYRIVSDIEPYILEMWGDIKDPSDTYVVHAAQRSDLELLLKNLEK